MPKKPGAGKLWTSTKKVQDLDIIIRDSCSKNFPTVLEIYEDWLTSPKATASQKQQAMKFFSDESIKLMKECRGKVQEDFADRVTTQESTRKKQIGRGGSGDKGSGTLQLLKITYDPEEQDTGTDN